MHRWICNLALLQIGEDPIITSLDEKSKAARICRILYEPGRNAVLESFPWSFALKREPLASLTGPAPTPWAYAYQKPADCLRVEEIISPTRDKPVPFAVEGDKILTDQAGAVLLYVVRRHAGPASPASVSPDQTGDAVSTAVVSPRAKTGTG